MRKKLIIIWLSIYLLTIITFTVFYYSKFFNKATMLQNIERQFLFYFLTIVGWSIFILIATLWVKKAKNIEIFNNNTLIRILFITVFTTMVFQPLIGLLNNIESRLPNYENRSLASQPELTKSDVSTFPKEFEAFVNDNFGFRTLFNNWNSIAHVLLLDTTTSPRVVLGKEGWLLYKTSLDDSIGITKFTEAQLLKIKNNIEEQNNFLTQRGIYYVIVIAPNKETIYPEVIPDIYHQMSIKRLDLLINYLKANDSKVPIIDLRQALLMAKEKYPVYWQTDTHWNKYGAFIAYCEIMKNLSLRFSSLVPPEESDYSIMVQKANRSGDLSNMLSMHDEFSDKVDVKVTMNKNYYNLNTLSSAIVFWDSFYESIDPYFSNNFTEILKPERSHNFDYNFINNKNPDVVINILVERRLYSLLSNKPG